MARDGFSSKKRELAPVFFFGPDCEPHLALEVPAEKCLDEILKVEAESLPSADKRFLF